MIPSYADFGIAEESAYPYLWADCIFAAAPCLGHSGSRLWDHITGQVSIATNYSPSRWTIESGLSTIYFLEATTGGFAFPTFSCEPNTISISIWLQTQFQTANRVALSIGTTGTFFRLFQNTDDSITANWLNSAIVNTASPSPAWGWTHIVAQRSRARSLAQLWINGSLSVSSTNSSTAQTQSVLCIGARRDSGLQSSPFTGAIDDVSIRQRLLDVDEIRLLASQRGIGYTRR